MPGSTQRRADASFLPGRSSCAPRPSRSWLAISSRQSCIGDVVKIRIGELETKRAALTDYITGTR
jgi:hypothetical protein